MAINAIFYENSIPKGTGCLEITGKEGPSGLFIPLHATGISGTFHGPVGSLTLTQTFRFARQAIDHPIEAITGSRSLAMQQLPRSLRYSVMRPSGPGSPSGERQSRSTMRHSKGGRRRSSSPGNRPMSSRSTSPAFLPKPMWWSGQPSPSLPGQFREDGKSGSR